MKNKFFQAVLCAILVPITLALAPPRESSAESATSEQGQPNVVEFDTRMVQVQESIRKMQMQMETVRQTEDPQVRQNLLREHWEALQSTMESMNGMLGPTMIGGQGRSGDAQLSPEQLKQRQYMNERYIGLQEMMTNQMLQHLQWVNRSSGTAASAMQASAEAGKRLYESVCVSCHGAGFAGAPRFGDKTAWAPRIRQGQTTLYEHALGGFRLMPPRGGSGASDDEVKAAVDYMVRAAK